MDKNVYILVLLSVIFQSASGAKPCVPRDYGEESIVCVCNATYCDTVDPIQTLVSGTYVTYTSSKKGLRFNVTYGRTESETSSNSDLLFYINHSDTYQTIKGFGGALSDSACINIKNLSDKAQEHLLRSYFSTDGIEYNVVRIPIGGTDFSTRGYTYDDGTEDIELTNFTLAPEDYNYKIPIIQQAVKISEQEILLFASAWTPPIWMKTNNNYYGVSLLKKEYYATWAQYIIKFLDSYAEKNVTFWAVTTGNEPLTSFVPFSEINSLGWTAGRQREWIEQYFGPLLNSSNHKGTLIIGADDQRITLPTWVSKILNYKDTAQYISGLGVHWYLDPIISTSYLDKAHDAFPEKFLLYTEACRGSYPLESDVDIGSWGRGMSYLKSIIETVNHWVVGWTDWNIALDLTGGPTWVANYVDSPILVNKSADEFYKQPMFYALGHVSKFVKRNSKRIYINPKSQKKVKVMAVQNPDNGTVVVFLNENNKEKSVSVKDMQRNGLIKLTLPPDSFVTLMYQE